MALLVVVLTACSATKVKRAKPKLALTAPQPNRIYAELVTPQFPIIQIEPREELLKQDPLWAGYYYSMEGFEIVTNYALVAKEYSGQCLNLFWAPTTEPVTIQRLIDGQWKDLRVLVSSVTNLYVHINDLGMYRLKLQ